MDRCAIQFAIFIINILACARLGVSYDRRTTCYSLYGSGLMRTRTREYYDIHIWIAKQLGKPKRCEHCDSTDKSKYEWANISHEYIRDVTDWMRLCCRCHGLYDKGRTDRHGKPTGTCAQGHSYIPDLTRKHSQCLECRHLSQRNRKLRIAGKTEYIPRTRSEWIADSRKHTPSSSIYRGVNRSTGGKWQAAYSKDNRRYNVGTFTDENEAAKAYLAAHNAAYGLSRTLEDITFRAPKAELDRLLEEQP